MNPELRPWQPPMIDHLREHDRAGVFAAMGSGKTLGTALALENIDLFDDAPALVLGPKRVANKTWPDELRRWDRFKHLEVQPVIGTATERFAALSNRNASIFTMNYENLPWLVQHFGIAGWPFKTIVSDESTRLKNYRTMQGGKRTQQLARVAWSKNVNRFIELTGTPTPTGCSTCGGRSGSSIGASASGAASPPTRTAGSRRRTATRSSRAHAR